VTNIPYEKILLICEALDVTPSYLFGWEEKKQPARTGELSEAKQAMYDFIDTLSDEQVRRLLQIAHAALDR
jgi:transcriptional regulator with XRE-family HTH domain